MRKKDQGAVKVSRNISLILFTCQILSAVICYIMAQEYGPYKIQFSFGLIPGSRLITWIYQTYVAAGRNFSALILLITELSAIMTNVFVFLACRKYGIIAKQQH